MGNGFEGPPCGAHSLRPSGLPDRPDRSRDETGVPLGRRSCKTGNFSICLAVISEATSSSKTLGKDCPSGGIWRRHGNGEHSRKGLQRVNPKMETTPAIRPKICDRRNTKPTIYPAASRFSTATWRWWTKCWNWRNTAGLGENPCLAEQTQGRAAAFSLQFWCRNSP